jgi:cleavage and polyadenylation specificity factor subunit 2
MITFTPLSGAAHSARTTPLAYLLQVDDVRILLDCGSPDWSPEKPALDLEHWEEYCQALREYVASPPHLIFRPKCSQRCAPTVDLVLLSHGDLAHCGLYAYAYSRWNLKAPTYTSLPVQAMGRIATTEDIEGIRDEEDIGDGDEPQVQDGDIVMEPEEGFTSPPVNRDKLKGKYVATLYEVQEAFDSVNTLRYSQPTRLQGLLA